MSLHETFGQPLLTFPDAEKSPLSIRAKALVFVDPRSRELRNDLEQLAPRALPVLIRGETGSGKELLARHIHRASDRTGLFVPPANPHRTWRPAPRLNFCNARAHPQAAGGSLP